MQKMHLALLAAIVIANQSACMKKKGTGSSRLFSDSELAEDWTVTLWYYNEHDAENPASGLALGSSQSNSTSGSGSNPHTTLLEEYQSSENPIPADPSKATDENRAAASSGSVITLIEGDIIAGEGAALGLSNQGFSSNDGRAWSNGTLIYSFAPGLPARHQSVVKSAMDEWTKQTGIKFQERTNETNYVYITHKNNGCYSYVGNINRGAQTLNLGTRCDHIGVALHELGHALGLQHEHCRTDRESYITIKQDKIDTKLATYENAFSPLGNTHGSYDFGSIMHYGKWAFSKNYGQAGEETIVPTEKYAGVQFGQRTQLSAGDIASIRELYGTSPGGITPPVVPTRTPTAISGGNAGNSGAIALDSKCLCGIAKTTYGNTCSVTRPSGTGSPSDPFLVQSSITSGCATANECQSNYGNYLNSTSWCPGGWAMRSGQPGGNGNNGGAIAGNNGSGTVATSAKCLCGISNNMYGLACSVKDGRPGQTGFLVQAGSNATCGSQSQCLQYYSSYLNSTYWCPSGWEFRTSF